MDQLCKLCGKPHATGACTEAKEEKDEKAFRKLTIKEAQDIWFNVPEGEEYMDEGKSLSEIQLAECMRAFLEDEPGFNEGEHKAFQRFNSYEASEARDLLDGILEQRFEHILEEYDFDLRFDATDPDTLQETIKDGVVEAHIMKAAGMPPDTDDAIDGTVRIDFANKKVEVRADFVDGAVKTEIPKSGFADMEEKMKLAIFGVEKKS